MGVCSRGAPRDSLPAFHSLTPLFPITALPLPPTSDVDVDEEWLARVMRRRGAGANDDEGAAAAAAGDELAPEQIRSHKQR